METTIYRPRTWRKHLWVVSTAMLLLWIAAIWANSLDGNRLWAMQSLYMFWVVQGFNNLSGAPLHLISSGVWAVVHPLSTTRLIPLAVANVEPTPRRWIVRWQEGRRRFQAKVRRDPYLDHLLTDALAIAQQERRPLPRTTAEAAATVTVGTLPSRQHDGIIAAIIVSMLALFGLAYWLNHPLWLLPACALPYILHRITPSNWLVATPDGLHVLIEGQEPLHIAASDVLKVEPDRRVMTAIVTTRSTAFPTFTLSEHVHAPLLKVIRRLITAQTATAEPGAAPQIGTRHCNLCGVAFTNMTKGQESILLCETCSNRVRFDAQESGHGLAGKDRRPV